MYYAWRRQEILTEFWPENLKESNHMEHPGIDEKRILKEILE
jgi:hypothetical protein